MLRKIRILSVSIPTFWVTSAYATDWSYTSQGSQATEITGGYGAVGNPSTGTVYNDGSGDSSYAVILDSGSSTFLMSQTVTDEFNVPLQQGVTYTETGIGGSEVENITQPLTSYYAPVSDADPDNTSTMTSFGTFTFESRQKDPLKGAVFFDIIGTPVIQNKVMVVTPSQTKNLFQSTLGALTAETTLQTTAPALPSQGLYHVPLTWTNFVTGSVPPSEGLNPVVEGVTARGPSNTDIANDWVFDSGAQFTIISPTYASELGLNMSTPVGTITGEGVGNTTVTFDGYQLTDIALPLSDGNRLVFNNPVVYVPQNTTLPAGLTGILGENLWMQSTNKINPLTGKPKGTFAPLFSQWYLDGPGSQLVLYDPNSTYNANTTATAIWNGGGTDNNWSTPGNWGGTTLAPNDQLVFGGTNRLAPNNDTAAGTQYDGITFNTAAGAFVIGGNTIDLAGDIVNNSTSLQTINANLAMQQNTNFNSVTGDLAVGGAIGGAFSLTKLGLRTLTLSGTNSYSGQTVVSAGTLVIGAAGALPLDTALSISGSSIVQLSPGIGHVTLSSLTIASGGQLDINNNGIFINYGSGPDPIASIETWIENGFHGRTGPAIISSAIATDDTLSGLSYGIGYADSADPGNPADLPGDTIEIMYTLLGDANLDGVVNSEDFTRISQNLNQNGLWDQGDFNYDGSVNAEDFTIFSQSLNQSAVLAAQASVMDQANGISLANVPEPASAGLLAMAGLRILRRRRRRSPCPPTEPMRCAHTLVK